MSTNRSRPAPTPIVSRLPSIRSGATSASQNAVWANLTIGDYTDRWIASEYRLSGSWAAGSGHLVPNPAQPPVAYDTRRASASLWDCNDYRAGPVILHIGLTADDNRVADPCANQNPGQ
jgi:hypothetical protein